MFEKIVKVGAYVAVFSLPLYLIRFQIGWIPFNLSEIIVYLVFLLWLGGKLSGFWKSGFQIQKPGFKNWRLFLPVFLILAGATISTSFSSEIEISAGIWKGWFLAPLLLFVVLWDCLGNKEFFKQLILATTLSGVAVALVSLFGWTGENYTYDSRLKGFYSSANYLAMYLSPLLVLSLALFRFAKKKIYQWLSAVAIGLMAAAVYLTYSYGAFFGLLAAAVFLVFFGVKKKNKFGWGLIFLSFTVLFLVSQFQTDKFQGFLDLSYPSLKSRLAIWQSAFEIAQDHPLVGIGPGIFQKYYLAYQPRFALYPEWAAPQPHNLFLAFWLQAGLIGLIGFIWLLVAFFMNTKRPCARESKALMAFLAAAMLVIVVHGLTDTTYWKNDLAAFFWLITALGFARPKP